jgi:hypothetical protein
VSGFLDFLLRPKPSAPAPTIKDLEGKLRELHESRAKSVEFLAGISWRGSARFSKIKR